MTETVTWQPIETAPKDGEYVLLWFPKIERDMRSWWDRDGWIVDAHGDIGQPTHWAPLLKGPGK